MTTAHRTDPSTPRQRFAAWRRTRPFWAGALVVVGGLVVVLFPLTPIPVRWVTAGIAVGPWDPVTGVRSLTVPVGLGAGLVLVAVGATLWLRPGWHTPLGVAATALGVVAFLAGHLGGLVVGMLLAIVGGGMGVAWTLEVDGQRDGRGHAAVTDEEQ